MKSTANSLKWSAIERLATQVIQLVVMLFLARMLGPHVFGLVGMLAVFIAVGQVFTDSGLTSALIRHSERTELDFSTAFYFNIFVSFFCYAILFFSAPFIASFFEQPQLVSLVRVLALVVIINSFTIVQRAKLTITMNFKTQAKASLLSVGISCIIAIWLAKSGYGVWALVGQTLTNAFFNVILLNIFHPWFPKTGFSKRSFNYLFSFGSKLLAASLLDTIFKNIYQMIIGKQFNTAQVGLFTQANQLSSVPAMTLTSIIQRVTYPMLSNIQNETEKFESNYLLTLRMSAFVVFPLMAGLGIIAKPFVEVVLGSDWSAAAELLMILSFAFMLYPIHAINLNLLQVKGRSDIFLKLEIIKKALIVLMLFITIPLGIKAICVGLLINTYVAFFINSYYTGKFSRLKIRNQLAALLPIWLIVLASALITYSLAAELVKLYSMSAYSHLMLIFVIMPVMYAAFARFMQNDLYSQIINIVLSRKV
ncbi:lipopolysaccharide biosynthesis protein [Pseudoalteromonas sp. SG44-5]|uniref:lipopolysaccharide biosynthesis protein n=1 Tax=Pseudoalteromonas sp. SG44-5 TaxID=2760960 RepID=UPI0015FB1F65|nr:lipopolysaccharide biosynthesis protein [Pseudoalteromonas sp. SG44-5]MBB1406059.1 lipopolysaccharide biosynthesis protein [Pseudoalteromonas sp. SG44-5]